MKKSCERALLGAIECHELFGEHDMAKKLQKEYRLEKNKSLEKDKEEINVNQVFEGTLVPAGWDKLEHVNQSSLYTQDDEDILLEHKIGINKFKPFFNQKVRIWGKITSNSREERSILVNKIISLIDDCTKPLIDKFDNFGNLIVVAV